MPKVCKRGLFLPHNRLRSKKYTRFYAVYAKNHVYWLGRIYWRHCRQSGVSKNKLQKKQKNTHLLPCPTTWRSDDSPFETTRKKAYRLVCLFSWLGRSDSNTRMTESEALSDIKKRAFLRCLTPKNCPFLYSPHRLPRTLPHNFILHPFCS